MNSTTVKAEDLNMGPYGGLTLDQDIDDDETKDAENNSHSADAPEAYSVYWEVTYSLSTKGEVKINRQHDLSVIKVSFQLLVRASLDCRELPVEVPRVGLSLALRPTAATNTTMWRGFGPHENYPVRACSVFIIRVLELKLCFCILWT